MKNKLIFVILLFLLVGIAISQSSDLRGIVWNTNNDLIAEVSYNSLTPQCQSRINENKTIFLGNYDDNQKEIRNEVAQAFMDYCITGSKTFQIIPPSISPPRRDDEVINNIR